jgi:hypothetical protein
MTVGLSRLRVAQFPTTVRLTGLFGLMNLAYTSGTGKSSMGSSKAPAGGSLSNLKLQKPAEGLEKLQEDIEACTDEAH